MGRDFDALADRVRQIHLRAGHWRYNGEVEVERGRGVLSRCFAFATRLPPSGRGALNVDIHGDADGERWQRHVGGHVMPSRLWRADGLLCERLGLVRFGFRLSAHDGALHWRVVRVHALGIPLPSSWFAGVRAREYSEQGRYHFDVRAALPGVGLLVHYRGSLDEGRPVG